MSDFLQWEVNGRFLQLPKRNYKVIAEFKPPIHDIPVSEVEYQVIKNLVDAAPDLLEVAEAVKTMFKIMHDKGSIHSIVCSGDVKRFS